MKTVACLRQPARCWSRPSQKETAMRFVYATRPLPKLEFATTNQREAIPADADVLAVCDGALTIRQLDDQAFATMTPEEQLTLHQLIIQAQDAEALARQTTSTNHGNFLSRIVRRFKH